MKNRQKSSSLILETFSADSNSGKLKEQDGPIEKTRL